jgi:hypothetical protein
MSDRPNKPAHGPATRRAPEVLRMSAKARGWRHTVDVWAAFAGPGDAAYVPDKEVKDYAISRLHAYGKGGIGIPVQTPADQVAAATGKGNAP